MHLSNKLFNLTNTIYDNIEKSDNLNCTPAVLRVAGVRWMMWPVTVFIHFIISYEKH